MSRLDRIRDTKDQPCLEPCLIEAQGRWGRVEIRWGAPWEGGISARQEPGGPQWDVGLRLCYISRTFLSSLKGLEGLVPSPGLAVKSSGGALCPGQLACRQRSNWQRPHE